MKTIIKTLLCITGFTGLASIAAYALIAGLDAWPDKVVHLLQSAGPGWLTAVAVLLLAHLAVTFTVLPSLPPPGNWTLKQLTTIAAIGWTALPFALLGLGLTANGTLSAIQFSVELWGGLYGLFLGGVLVILTAADAVFSLSNYCMDTLSDQCRMAARRVAALVRV